MMRLRSLYGVFAVLALTTPLAGQQAAGSRPAPPPAAAAIKAPEDYVIGADDVLTIVFWREKEMSSEVTVRPDGKITLPLINDVVAAGLTPEQLRVKLTTDSARFIEDPSVSVVVKTINSRKIFITGQVSKPGTYNLTAPMTVMQFIAIAGGLNEFAHRDEIIIMRTENGKQRTYPFDYSGVIKRSKLDQNISLQPGDTVVVP
jgi:polysaccharide export outer membrane protein